MKKSLILLTTIILLSTSSCTWTRALTSKPVPLSKDEVISVAINTNPMDALNATYVYHNTKFPLTWLENFINDFGGGVFITPDIKEIQYLLASKEQKGGVVILYGYNAYNTYSMINAALGTITNKFGNVKFIYVGTSHFSEDIKRLVLERGMKYEFIDIGNLKEIKNNLKMSNM